MIKVKLVFWNTMHWRGTVHTHLKYQTENSWSSIINASLNSGTLL